VRWGVRQEWAELIDLVCMRRAHFFVLMLYTIVYYLFGRQYKSNDLYTNAFPSKKANILIVHSSLKVHPIISWFIPVSCCSFVCMTMFHCRLKPCLVHDMLRPRIASTNVDFAHVFPSWCFLFPWAKTSVWQTLHHAWRHVHKGRGEGAWASYSSDCYHSLPYSYQCIHILLHASPTTDVPISCPTLISLIWLYLCSPVNRHMAKCVSLTRAITLYRPVLFNQLIVLF